MDPVIATLGVLALAVVAFVSNRIPLGVVAIGVSLALYFTGVLPLAKALAGFGDPTVIFIASLFIVSDALDSTGVTVWAGHKVIAHAGTKRGVLLTVVCLLVAILTALISVNELSCRAVLRTVESDRTPHDLSHIAQYLPVEARDSDLIIP